MKNVILAAAFALSALSAQAATINEGSTDFTNQSIGAVPLSPTPSAFDLSDIGINTVSGSLSATCDPFSQPSCTGGDFSDSFSVFLNPNRAIQSVTFSVFDAVASFGGNDQGQTNDITFTIAESIGNVAFTLDTISGNGSGGLFITNAPVNGIFNFAIQASSGPFPTDVISAKWRLDIGVADITPSSVPLPATALLLLGGLAGLGMARRHRS